MHWLPTGNSYILCSTKCPTGVFGKESELDKMADSHSMAGPFAPIPSQNVFKSQARTPNLPATQCLSILALGENIATYQQVMYLVCLQFPAEIHVLESEQVLKK